MNSGSYSRTQHHPNAKTSAAADQPRINRGSAGEGEFAGRHAAEGYTNRRNGSSSSSLARYFPA